MRCRAFVLLAVMSAAPAFGQAISRPTDAPVATAENESWYRLGEPLLFAGDAYYQAGAAVFFNGNTMVRTGHYNGVPLYADTTIEPYSIVLVPIGRGLMQPYERLRSGVLAGTTGSRQSSFPPRLPSEAGAVVPAAAGAPTALPQPLGAISAFTPGGADAVVGGRGPAADAPVGAGAVGVGTSGAAAAPGLMTTIRRAESNDGVWLRFRDGKWVSDGPAIALRQDEFVQVGDYDGFPVFARRAVEEERIYLPTAAGMVAPFRLKE